MIDGISLFLLRRKAVRKSAWNFELGKLNRIKFRGFLVGL